MLAAASSSITVAPTATTGVYASRISSQIRTGKVLTVGPARKDRQHDLVERRHEREHRAAD
jgi:hypothetical protein